jgi:hypothetical protein
MSERTALSANAPASPANALGFELESRLTAVPQFGRFVANWSEIYRAEQQPDDPIVRARQQQQAERNAEERREDQSRRGPELHAPQSWATATTATTIDTNTASGAATSTGLRSQKRRRDQGLAEAQRRTDQGGREDYRHHVDDR